MAPSGRTFLVTGGAGFLGINVVRSLLERGDNVRVLDDLSTGGPEALSSLRGDIDFRQGDITDPEELQAAVKGIDTVIHLAAHRMQKTCEDPRRADAVNAGGTLLLLEMASKAGIRRVVYASSAAVYGDSESFPQKENMPVLPISPYGMSKLAAEEHCRRFGESGDLETVSLRYFNIYGPGQRQGSQYSGVITAFIEQLMHGYFPCENRVFFPLNPPATSWRLNCRKFRIMEVGKGSQW